MVNNKPQVLIARSSRHGQPAVAGNEKDVGVGDESGKGRPGDKDAALAMAATPDHAEGVVRLGLRRLLVLAAAHHGRLDLGDAVVHFQHIRGHFLDDSHGVVNVLVGGGGGAHAKPDHVARLHDGRDHVQFTGFVDGGQQTLIDGVLALENIHNSPAHGIKPANIFSSLLLFCET